MLLVAAMAIAQTNQYPGATGTISKSGYAYKYRNAPGFDGPGTSVLLELYNSASTYLDVEWAYADGTGVPMAKLLGEDSTPDFSSVSQTFNQTFAMVNGCFTSQQKSLLNGKRMIINVRFNPATGRVADVSFTFFRDEPFANIPVETYRSIELALKEELTITATAEGRRLNYIEFVWEQEF